MLKHTIYSPGLKFVKEGVSSPPAIIADSLEQFIEETPEIVFNRYNETLAKKNKQQPTFNMDDFDAYLKWRADQARKEKDEGNGEPYN